MAYDYTATGELAARTHNGQTSQFAYSYSVATRPILAERKAGAFTRFYVALQDGRLLYEIELTPTPAARFYHFGKVGETRLLTDAAGAVTDAYAYDAYGRLLARTGSSDQIYAFVGELGVRDDPAAGLIHMRARHYDPKSGRFLSRDPIFLALMGRNSQSANPYHYVEGMPTWVTDPSGLDAFFSDMWAFDRGKWEDVNDANPSDQNVDADDTGMMFVFGGRPELGGTGQTTVRDTRPDDSVISIIVGNSKVDVSLNDAEPAFIVHGFDVNKIGQGAAEAGNKAAAKALIRRALGEFLRFVPLGGQEVESGEEEAVDESIGLPGFQDDVEDMKEESQGDIS